MKRLSYNKTKRGVARPPISASKIPRTHSGAEERKETPSGEAKAMEAKESATRLASRKTCRVWQNQSLPIKPFADAIRLASGWQRSIGLLKMLFDVHEMSRTEIIEHCKFQILSLKPRECKPVTRTTSYYRKAMFNREETVRAAATSEVLDLILADKSKYNGPFSLQESSSQASSSQQGELLNGKKVGLLLELSSLLQRCLYQQAKVKEILYAGLLKLVLVEPSTASPVLDLLLPHFLRYYHEDDELHLNLNSLCQVNR